ncbi:MAG TPA: Hsp70 family protein [Dermatophilaceae bacterium]|nr:Hsp70 family protein [Dermatophilaceae bacterium]
MPLGVDLGTTRTIVAFGDRGNYPVVAFTDHHGDAHEFFPSVVADAGGELVFGFAALEAAEAGAPLVRSFKRALADPGAGPHTTVLVGSRQIALVELLTGFCTALRTALAETSNAPADLLGERPQVIVSVPAHAHGAQRLVTLEAFRRAGFEVLGMLNEPSAAGFEFTHRQSRAVTSRRNLVLVYDLGGGTFDASVVQVEGTRHEVLASLGINRLGGDDLDEVLAELVLRTGEIAADSLSDREAAALRDECRDAKERLSPQSRRMSIDVAGELVTVAVEDFYTAAAPLVQQSVDVMSPLVGALGDEGSDLGTVAGIYLVGGSSGLPLVPRMLRERYGRRVHRSPYPAASTAIGLAIAGDAEAGYTLTDRLSRGFGVFRERDAGHGIGFDPIFTPDLVVTPGERVVVTRRYQAAHNVGWFRFVEYTSVDEVGEPRGDLTPFPELLFPFAPELQGEEYAALAGVSVHRRDPGPLVEEVFTVDEHGIVEATIRDLHTGHERTATIRG